MVAGAGSFPIGTHKLSLMKQVLIIFAKTNLSLICISNMTK